MVQRKGYLYSMWSGALKVYEGCVEQSVHGGDRYHFYVRRGTKIIRRVMCNGHPGFVSNATVWLEERDDKKAIDILIQYENEQIEELKDRIRKYIQRNS